MAKRWIEELIPSFAFDDPDSGFAARDGDFWKASTLYEHARKTNCRPFRCDLRTIDLSDMRFANQRTLDFASHLKRALEADLSKPILLGPAGVIMDGYHRIAKALAKGITHLPCIRLTDLPEPDERKKKLQ